ncbi:DUF4231 domain-containing protein [Mesomycoplasma lagogenitalium]|uniref:DUF4231 domain-containing protein n=1 Tax=Mesomycoplasma lagogenitalium TaxID=171286 RepID=A0ABY8LTT1_9BACT|nr:DUF4231 domain-containing protein [Mesomycoplasma lagogenitalium]WGI36644.1 DUF4231 domain-containing protein [Mesomycoplasma lagogenitalium]
MENLKYARLIYRNIFIKSVVLKTLFFSLTFATFAFIFISSIFTAFYLAGHTIRFRVVLPKFSASDNFRDVYVLISGWFSAAVTFCTSIISFFTMNDKYKQNKKYLITLRLEFALYKAKIGIYKKARQRETVFLERTMIIANWNAIQKEANNKPVILSSKSKSMYYLQDLDEYTEKQTLQYAKDIQKLYQRKLFVSYTIFAILNIILIIMSSLMVVINLYSLRFNQFPDIPGTEGTIYYLIIVTSISAFVTFLTSISSFFSFSERRAKLNSDIQELENKLNEFKTVPIEDLNGWIESIANYDEDLSTEM